MTRTSLFVLGLLAFASVSAAQGRPSRERAATEDDPWTGCEVVETTRTVRELRCPRFAMRLFLAPSLSDATSLAALAASVDGARDAVPGRLMVGEVVVPTVESATLLMAVPYPGLGAGCLGPRDDARARCREAIVALARRRSLPPGVTFPEPRMSFFGHELQLPAGCVMVGTERISCDATEAAVDWREAPTRPDVPAERMVERTAELLRNTLSVTREGHVTCTLRGHVGVGRRLDAEIQGHPVSMVICAANREGTSALAQCMSTSLSPGAAWPSPCDQIFDGTISSPTSVP